MSRSPAGRAEFPFRPWSGPLLLLGYVAGWACGAAPDAERSPEAIVRMFLQALERQDVEGALALLDDDFVFRDAAGSFAATKEELPAMLAWDAAAEGRPEIVGLSVSGDTVRTRIVERNRFTELLDLEPWNVQATFVVREGRIVEEVARELTGDGPGFEERFHRALEPVRRWAAAERPAEAREVFEDGRVARYDGATARRLMALIVAYRRDVGAGR